VRESVEAQPEGIAMGTIDVVIPCYRYAAFLSDCVESVLSQDVDGIRVLVIDDASPDHTAEVAARLAANDARVSFVRHPVNLRHIATYNEGLAWATAKYTLLLSADDYLTPHALARAIDLMERHPEVGFTYGRAIELGEGDAKATVDAQALAAPIGTAAVMPGLAYIEANLCRNVVPTPTAVVRTAVQKQVGPYRPDLPHSGDMEMWLRFAAHASVGRVDACQAVYRKHAANMSRAYYASHMLPDLQQRRTAIDSFFDGCSTRLPDPAGLRARMYGALGREAVGFASAAFNEGELAAAGCLGDFALALDPGVARSWPGFKYALKRALGPEGWRSLQSLRSRRP
jgi:glycosyltransferase involved in cell wall biosynthesis